MNVLLQVLLGFWLPTASKEMVDGVLAPGGHLAANPDLRLALWLIVSMLLAVMVGCQALAYLFNRLMYRLVAHVSQNLRTQVAAHMLLLLSRQYYDSSQLGRLILTAVGDPSNITQQLAMGMINALAQGFYPVFGGCFILFRYEC